MRCLVRFNLIDSRDGIVCSEKRNAWNKIDIARSDPRKVAYWVSFENRVWCLLFDTTLIDKISIVWPKDWKNLNVNLPPWGAYQDLT